MTTARILGSARERRTVELLPEPLVASYLMRGSAGCIIVTTGLPDPKRIVLKPQPELHPYIHAGHSPGCYQRESWHQQSTPRSISRCSFRHSRLGLASLLARMTFWRSTGTLKANGADQHDLADGDDRRFSTLFLCGPHLVSRGRASVLCVGLAEVACRRDALGRSYGFAIGQVKNRAPKQRPQRGIHLRRNQ